MHKLELGSKGPLLIRRETVGLDQGQKPYKLMYASDLHFLGKYSEDVADHMLDCIQKTKPDLILLGGDLIEAPAGCGVLARFIHEASDWAPVWAVRGNHDVIIPKDKLKTLVQRAGGHWLEDTNLNIRHGHSHLKIDGTLRLFSPLMTVSDFPILCAHNPDVFPQAAKLHYRLVLAGHLHGGQAVFWEKQNRLYPGAFFYQWNGLKFQMNDTTLLVSRGVADTVPIRWNCPREMIMCEIY